MTRYLGVIIMVTVSALVLGVSRDAAAEVMRVQCVWRLREGTGSAIASYQSVFCWHVHIFTSFRIDMR